MDQNYKYIIGLTVLVVTMAGNNVWAGEKMRDVHGDKAERDRTWWVGSVNKAGEGLRKTRNTGELSSDYKSSRLSGSVGYYGGGMGGDSGSL